MRLVDADALPSALFQKHVHYEEELEPMLYFNDAVEVVENAPTIDAIPVEWLKKRREQLRPKEYGGLGVAAITKVLMYWQKEQEAR